MCVCVLACSHVRVEREINSENICSLVIFNMVFKHLFVYISKNSTSNLKLETT